MRGLNETLMIYVVDDDDAVRDSLEVLLEPEGFVIRSYASAEEFLADLDGPFAKPSNPACLLLDLNMPGKGGMELLTILAEHDNGLPVVVMTGNIDEKTKSRALNSGAVAFLEKPVDADDLIDTLRNTLS